jgi:hypothetical protein
VKSSTIRDVLWTVRTLRSLIVVIKDELVLRQRTVRTGS